MSDPYNDLLEATIRHLQELRAQGVQFVSVSPETLARLTKGPPSPAARNPLAPPERKAPVLPSDIEPLRRPAPKSPEVARPKPAASKPPEQKTAAEQSLPLSLPGEKPSAPPPKAAALSPEAKAAAFAELRQRALACVKCAHLARSRKNVVFGVGDIGAQLMFVGEAPGADEDQQGEPFVGAAGQLLTKIIQTMGLTRQSVYIANILKCRPDTPGQSAGNRKPTPQEMETCIPYLHEQIDLIEPKVLVALGATAVEGLLGKTVGITKLRGHWKTYRGIPLMPTYHPAYLLRNQALAEKRRVWEDMLQVMEKLAMPISEKQRGFFLK
jgi:DNA polymerase